MDLKTRIHTKQVEQYQILIDSMDFGFENQNPYPLFSLKQRKAVKYNHRKKQMISAEKEKSKCNIKNKIQTRRNEL